MAQGKVEKVSELIAELMRIKRRYGDIEVWWQDGCTQGEERLVLEIKPDDCGKPYLVIV